MRLGAVIFSAKDEVKEGNCRSAFQIMHLAGEVVVGSHREPPTGALLLPIAPGSVAPELLPSGGALALSINEPYSVTGIGDVFGRLYAVTVHILESVVVTGRGNLTLPV